MLREKRCDKWNTKSGIKKCQWLCPYLCRFVKKKWTRWEIEKKGVLRLAHQQSSDYYCSSIYFLSFDDYTTKFRLLYVVLFTCQLYNDRVRFTCQLFSLHCATVLVIKSHTFTHVGSPQQHKMGSWRSSMATGARGITPFFIYWTWEVFLVVTPAPTTMGTKYVSKLRFCEIFFGGNGAMFSAVQMLYDSKFRIIWGAYLHARSQGNRLQLPPLATPPHEVGPERNQSWQGC